VVHQHDRGLRDLHRGGRRRLRPCASTASGDRYEAAYASTGAYGDVTAGQVLETDTAESSLALSVGLAVDIA
jgi:hypothetical protein